MIPKEVKLTTDGESFCWVAADYIYPNTLIGVTHIKEEILHTLTLGEFLKDSRSPNCMILTNPKYYSLWTTDEIYAGEELTITKSLYGLM